MWSYYLKDNVHISEHGEKMPLLRTLLYLIFLSHPRTPEPHQQVDPCTPQDKLGQGFEKF